MKTLFFSISLLLAALTAHAMPAIGDSAFYEATVDGQGVQQRVTLMEYNSGTHQYRKETVTAVGTNAPQTSDEWVNESDVPSEETLQALVANCAQNNGTPETITVPAGTMATCKIPLQRGGTANLAPVPFGIVKIDSLTDDGKPLSISLASFSRGNQ